VVDMEVVDMTTQQIECPLCDGDGGTMELCNHCNGSGEGMVDGSRCVVCGGSSVVPVACEHCDDGIIMSDDSRVLCYKTGAARELAALYLHDAGCEYEPIDNADVLALFVWRDPDGVADKYRGSG